MEEGKGFDRAFFYFIRDRMGEEEADLFSGMQIKSFESVLLRQRQWAGHACFLKAPCDRAYQEDMGQVRRCMVKWQHWVQTRSISLCMRKKGKAILNRQDRWRAAKKSDILNMKVLNAHIRDLFFMSYPQKSARRLRRQTHRIFVGSQRKKEKKTDGREAGKGGKKRGRKKE